jgi:hypothetical protein
MRVQVAWKLLKCLLSSNLASKKHVCTAYMHVIQESARSPHVWEDVDASDAIKVRRDVARHMGSLRRDGLATT